MFIPNFRLLTIVVFIFITGTLQKRNKIDCGHYYYYGSINIHDYSLIPNTKVINTLLFLFLFAVKSMSKPEQYKKSFSSSLQ